MVTRTRGFLFGAYAKSLTQPMVHGDGDSFTRFRPPWHQTIVRPALPSLGGLAAFFRPPRVQPVRAPAPRGTTSPTPQWTLSNSPTLSRKRAPPASVKTEQRKR